MGRNGAGMGGGTSLPPPSIYFTLPCLTITNTSLHLLSTCFPPSLNLSSTCPHPFPPYLLQRLAQAMSSSLMTQPRRQQPDVTVLRNGRYMGDNGG